MGFESWGWGWGWGGPLKLLSHTLILQMLTLRREGEATCLQIAKFFGSKVHSRTLWPPLDEGPHLNPLGSSTVSKFRVTA